MNRIFLLIVFHVFVLCASAQIFHFEEHSTTLVKTTDQSPAHWYIEIFNDVSVDSSLRWKAFFESIPAQWQISLDDQTNYTTNIQDGDSADFVLIAGEPFPQKLIIGAVLNDTPGIGSVFFDIFDPEFPSFRDNIEFQFIISSVGLNELVQSGIVSFENAVLRKKSGGQTIVKMIDQSGKTLVYDSNFISFDCTSLPQNELIFISIQQGDKSYFVKWLR